MLTKLNLIISVQKWDIWLRRPKLSRFCSFWTLIKLISSNTMLSSFPASCITFTEPCIVMINRTFILFVWINNSDASEQSSTRACFLSASNKQFHPEKQSNCSRTASHESPWDKNLHYDVGNIVSVSRWDWTNNEGCYWDRSTVRHCKHAAGRGGNGATGGPWYAAAPGPGIPEPAERTGPRASR